jgi:hypothetical protein
MMAASLPDMRYVDRRTELVARERELAAALRAYEFSGTPGLHETACVAVCACVDAMRAAAWSPEAVVVSIKQIARRAGFGSPFTVLRQGGPGERDLRLEGLVTCAIRRYFCLGATTFYVAPVWMPVALVC